MDRKSKLYSLMHTMYNVINEMRFGFDKHLKQRQHILQYIFKNVKKRNSNFSNSEHSI